MSDRKLWNAQIDELWRGVLNRTTEAWQEATGCDTPVEADFLIATLRRDLADMTVSAKRQNMRATPGRVTPETCIECGQNPTSVGHDACIGTLPAPCMNACCGHDRPTTAYVQFWPESGMDRLSGADALSWILRHKAASKAEWLRDRWAAMPIPPGCDLEISSDLNAYQERTGDTWTPPTGDAWRAPSYLVAGLCSEAGEVAGVFKRQIRDGTPHEDAREKMRDELGDVLWYVARLAAEYDLDLSDVARRNIDKLRDRKARGVIGGSGDQR